MNGGQFALKCMSLADSPDKWWSWVRKLARYTVPFSFAVQLVFVCFMGVVALVGSWLIGIFWTLPRWLRSYYDEQPTWRV